MVNLVRVTIEQLHTNLFMYTSVMVSFRTSSLTLRSGKTINDRDALNLAESTAIGMRFHRNDELVLDTDRCSNGVCLRCLYQVSDFLQKIDFIPYRSYFD